LRIRYVQTYPLLLSDLSIIWIAFSFYGAALASFDTDNSFFYVAALTFLIQVPGIFLFRTPVELPLRPTDDDQISETVNETTKDANGSEGDNTKEEDRTTKKADSTIAGFKEADVPLMTNAELSRTSQSWIQLFTWTTAFIPGVSLNSKCAAYLYWYFTPLTVVSFSLLSSIPYHP
jgi:hypothetical protein